MGNIVSTGQITIVDNNDARPITAFISASNGLQQSYSKDESSETFIPNWNTSNNVLTAFVYVGEYVGGVSAVTDVTSQLTNRKWTTDLGASIGSGVSYTLTNNLTSLQPVTYYFEGDYTDPVTGLKSHVVANTSISVVKVGTNAVYLLTRGVTAIQESHTATKNTAVVCADLIRASGVDTTGVSYKFYRDNGGIEINSFAETYGVTWNQDSGTYLEVTGSTVSLDVASKFGFKTTNSTDSPIGLESDIGVGIPLSGEWTAFNTLVIKETAVQDIEIFRIEAKDADGRVYQIYFTVYDISDPYDVKILSSSGDKLQNGVGTSTCLPQVYNGSTVVDISGWEFNWYFYDTSLGTADGRRAGFIDTTRTTVAEGKSITGNTAGANSTLTYSGSAITVFAGDMVKVVSAAGVPYYYEVQSGAGSTVSVRPATFSPFLNNDWPTSAITLNQFTGGKLFICTGTGVTAGTRHTSGYTPITFTGFEVDVKARITCEAIRP